MDSILQADDALSNSFHEANTTTSGSTGQGLMEWLYSFKTGFASDKREWLFYGGTEFVPIYEISPQFPGIPAVVGYEKQYVGGIYEGTEINYIIQGHAAARIGIPYAAVAAGVLAHNQIRPPDPGETVPLVPTDKLFWLRKGYTEYGKRRNW